ncbi:hypothetical protein CFD26_104653 [Aspergillus turcosus]|uniref:Uncharacterized protein n=1 Tax=Aspergillus turcosus TaxID=1245748 RepID=A0A3R7LWP3_9EURO|nr:hypothetical protein CFD26_104653 [Aspergillus turcosus]
MDLTAVVPKDMWGVYIPVFEKPDHKCLINIGSVTATRREVTTLCRSAKDDGDDTSASTVRRRTPRKQFPSSTPASGSSARVTRSTARGQLALPQPSIEGTVASTPKGDNGKGKATESTLLKRLRQSVSI